MDDFNKFANITGKNWKVYPDKDINMLSLTLTVLANKELTKQKLNDHYHFIKRENPFDGLLLGWLANSFWKYL